MMREVCGTALDGLAGSLRLYLARSGDNQAGSGCVLAGSGRAVGAAGGILGARMESMMWEVCGTALDGLAGSLRLYLARSGDNQAGSGRVLAGSGGAVGAAGGILGARMDSMMREVCGTALDRCDCISRDLAIIRRDPGAFWREKWYRWARNRKTSLDE